jgi:DNA-binding response OmpR family regulator
MVKGRYDEGPESRRAEPPQVLVVDDEPANVRLVQAYLKAEGFRVVGANSGPEALERVEQGGVDLVLLDIRMPHMDGFEVCRRLRENKAHTRMPVIFLTAEFNDADSELKGLEAGADEYLHKPIQRRALVARVRNLIRLADAERDRRLVAQLAQSEKLAAIGQIAAGVAQGNAQATEDVKRLAREQTRASAGMTSAALELTNLSVELRSIVSRFKLG